MKKYSLFIVISLMLLCFPSAQGLACGYTSSGDYLCGTAATGATGGGVTGGATSTGIINIPPIAGGGVIPPILTNGPTTSFTQAQLSSAETRLRTALDKLTPNQLARVSSVLDDVDVEDIINFEGDLVQGSGSGTSFMGQNIASIGIQGTNNRFQVDITDDFENGESGLSELWTRQSVNSLDFSSKIVKNGNSAAAFGPSRSEFLEIDHDFGADTLSLCGWFFIPAGQSIRDLEIMRIERNNNIPPTSIRLDSSGRITLQHYEYDDDDGGRDYEIRTVRSNSRVPRNQWVQICLNDDRYNASVTVNGSRAASINDRDRDNHTITSLKMGIVSSRSNNTLYGDDFNIDIN